jgi:hypothetical protein
MWKKLHDKGRLNKGKKIQQFDKTLTLIMLRVILCFQCKSIEKDSSLKPVKE